MKNLLADVSQAARSVGRRPVTSLVIAATVAIGIAAGSTVFSIVDTLLLRSLPGVARQSDLVNVHATEADGTTFHSVSYPTYKDLRDRSRSLSGLTAFSSRLVSLATGDEPRLGIVQIVSGNYFDVLSARAASGRLLAPGDDEAGRDLVAVVSQTFARDDLRGLSSAVGQTLKINGRAFTIVGVAPAGFCGTFLAQPFDVWVPISAWAVIGSTAPLDQRDRAWLELVGRKRSGIALQQVRADLEPIARQLEREHPANYRGVGYDPRPVTGFEDSLLGGALGVFGVLTVMAALILLVGCVNVGGIFLARSASRAREIAVRAALGARRHELMRPLLLEQMILFVAGGGLGLALTAWTARLLERFDIPTPIPLRFDFSPTIRVAAFALALSVIVGLVFGLSAAIFATRRVSTDALRGRFELPGTSRVLGSVVAVQLAACVLLLACAGLFIRTVLQAVNRNPGFQPENLVMTQVDLSVLGYTPAQIRSFDERIVERLAALPGVDRATVAGVVPLGPGHRGATVRLPESAAERDAVEVDTADVWDSYFQALRIPILRGRAFLPSDRAGAPLAAVVNETLARRLWPQGDAVGRRISSEGKSYVVVGVAQDGKYRTPGEPQRSFLYVASRQEPTARPALVLHTERDLALITPAIRRELRRLDPAIPFAAVYSVRHHMGFSLLPQRILLGVSATLGGIGLLLAAVGLAGLVGYSVSRRTREIGVRVALGATPGDVVRLEMRRGLTVATAGLAGGTAVALAAARLLRSLTFGIEPHDPLTFALVLLLLAMVAISATYLPSRSAARIDPMTALRSE